MADLAIILFDDAIAQQWEPFALTRPIGELLLGALTFRSRAERVVGASCSALLAADHLAGFEEPGTPVVRGLGEPPLEEARLFLSSRFIPAWGARSLRERLPVKPARLVASGQTVGWYAPPGSPPPAPEFLLHPEREDPAPGANTGGEMILEGEIVDRVWQLIHRNPDRLAADIGAMFPEAPRGELPAGVYKIGGGAVILGKNVGVEPGVVLDTTDGPIWLDDDARVQALTRLAGPAYIGRGATLLGGRIAAVTVGPACKVHGELAESICLGYANKQHDGHVGHAYLGRWVNLGAGTTNSDLKNNYGTIRMWTPAGETDTGQIKLGSLLGDHVKTGIGLLLNTGTVVGAGSNLFGAAMPPKHVPAFSWGSGEDLSEFRLDKFLEVAERAMGRRGQELGDGMRQVLSRAWERGRAAT